MFKKNKKKKNNGGAELSEVGKKFNIRISTPNGYFPEDVDKILIDLEKQLNNISTENKQMEQKLSKLSDDYQRLQTEFRKQSFEIMQLNFQDTSELQDYSRLEKLANINPEVGDIPDIEPVEALKAEIPIDVIEDAPSVFENLISQTPQKERPTIKKQNKNMADIFTEDGKLEIL